MVSESLASPAGPRRLGAIATFGLGFAIQLAAGLAALSVFLLSSLLLVGLRPISLVKAYDIFQEYEAASRIAREVMDVGYLSHGLLFSLSVLAAVPVGVFLTRFFAPLYDASPRVFLGLRRPTVRQALPWLAAIVVLRYGLAVLLDRMGIDAGGESMIDHYRTASFLPLLFLAVVVAGPIFKEVLFRGFLLEGWRRTRLGTVGATVLTAALWALCHYSYAAPMIAIIFCDGIVLAMARLRTGSTYLAIGMHGLINLLVLIHVGSFLANNGTEYFLERGREHLGKEQHWKAFLAFREAERYTKGPCPECQVGLAQAYLGSGEPQGKARAATLAHQVLGSEPQADLERRARVLLCLSRSKSPLPRHFSLETLQPTEPAFDRAVRGTGGVQPPHILLHEEPVYPEAARLRRQQGSVIVESVIDQEGCVTDARVLRGTAPDLDEAAVDAVRRWVFLPATFQGRPVKVYYSVTVNFQIQQGSSSEEKDHRLPPG